MGMERGTWLQCQHCGHIYHVDKEVPMEYMYVRAYCACCNKYERHLNCGDQLEDAYYYYNPNLDERYY